MTLEKLNEMILEWWEARAWNRGDVTSDKFYRWLDAEHRLRDYAYELKRGLHNQPEKEPMGSYDIRLVKCPQCGYRPRDVDVMTISGHVVEELFKRKRIHDTRVRDLNNLIGQIERIGAEKEDVDRSLSIAKERIEKLEAEKAESEHALGFAVEAVERLEAEKAEMAIALKTMVEMVEMNGFGKHYALDLAKAAIGRDEE